LYFNRLPINTLSG